jgi:hypothetical protein
VGLRCQLPATAQICGAMAADAQIWNQNVRFGERLTKYSPPVTIPSMSSRDPGGLIHSVAAAPFHSVECVRSRRVQLAARSPRDAGGGLSRPAPPPPSQVFADPSTIALAPLALCSGFAAVSSARTPAVAPLSSRVLPPSGLGPLKTVPSASGRTPTGEPPAGAPPSDQPLLPPPAFLAPASDLLVR